MQVRSTIEHDEFLNVAHRGASAMAPENTFAAFEAAIDARASAVEMDLRMTSDGHVVVIHDSTVDRTADGTGDVDRMSADELARLDAGSWFDPRFAGERIPLLEEVFERLGGRVSLVMHIKVARCGVEDRVVELARSHAIVDQVGCQDLDRDLAVERDLSGGVDDAHRTAGGGMSPLEYGR